MTMPSSTYRCIISAMATTHQMTHTYNDERIRHASNDVEFRFEDKGQVAKDAAQEVNGHEWDRDTLDFAVLPDLVVLRTEL